MSTLPEKATSKLFICPLVCDRVFLCSSGHTHFSPSTDLDHHHASPPHQLYGLEFGQRFYMEKDSCVPPCKSQEPSWTGGVKRFLEVNVRPLYPRYTCPSQASENRQLPLKLSKPNGFHRIFHHESIWGERGRQREDQCPWPLYQHGGGGCLQRSPVILINCSTSCLWNLS